MVKVIKWVVTATIAISIITSSSMCFAEEDMDYAALKAKYEELEEKYNSLYNQYQDVKNKLSELLIYMEMDDGEKTKSETASENIVYSGEWGVLTFKGADENGVNFSLENTTDIDYVVYSDYLSLDGTQYSEDWDEETEEAIGGVYENIAAGSIKNFKFLVKLDTCDISDITGQFLICEFGTGCDLGLINF